jgi:hypothetical protein
MPYRYFEFRIAKTKKIDPGCMIHDTRYSLVIKSMCHSFSGIIHGLDSPIESGNDREVLNRGMTLLGRWTNI